ncbi:MAG: translation initiation factor [Muribaculaceae bacterium]|nr:translation initiation factor [Muribaculaceae bacterium]
MDWKEMLSQVKDSLPEDKSGSGNLEEKEEKAGKPAKKEKLSIAMEKKGRGGKTATIIFGFTSDDEEIRETATRLKQRLGIGGSSRGGEILLQGDVREKVKPLLKDMGYRI